MAVGKQRIVSRFADLLSEAFSNWVVECGEDLSFCRGN